MKTLKGDICDHQAQGATFDEWMNAMKPHYAEAHVDVMMNKSGLTDEQKREEMMKWMAENKARFDVAPDNKAVNNDIVVYRFVVRLFLYVVTRISGNICRFFKCINNF